MRMETHFHMKDLALSLTLKQRLKATRKWPIYFELAEGSSYRESTVLKIVQLCKLFRQKLQRKDSLAATG